MRKRLVHSTALLSLLVIAISLLVFSPAYHRGAAMLSPAGQGKTKKPIEIAKERDWEVEGNSEAPGGYGTLASLIEGAYAILHGRITEARSFWDESGHPIEHGENITTEYKVEVLRVLKDETWRVIPKPGEPAPPPVTTPLVISRNGGVVYVNGHRASVKVKEYESLAAGKEYLFFLDWSPAYKTYVLAGGASGAMMVNEDLSLKPLAKSKEIQEKLRGVSLEAFINQLSRNH